MVKWWRPVGQSGRWRKSRMEKGGVTLVDEGGKSQGEIDSRKAEKL